ncbi:MAG: hypothetical protein FJW31_08880 [Acidobacteria bacterium]|nr:hypothetical protein [Acidobacteriota bacterium]
MQRAAAPFFAAALLLAVVGLWPGFFAKLPETPLPHHVHGWSATAWMVLPLLQYALIRHGGGGRHWHRRIGYASIALAAIVAVSGVYVVRMMAYKNIASFRLASVKFVWLDLTGIALFCIYVAFAIQAARRRDIRLHVAALAASALIRLEAALERVFVNWLPALVADFDAALYAALVFLELTCAALIWLEWRGGRPRWPLPVLLGYCLVMHATATPLARSESFQRFSNWFGAAGR